jgi:hypothetical protein
MWRWSEEVVQPVRVQGLCRPGCKDGIVQEDAIGIDVEMVRGGGAA